MVWFCVSTIPHTWNALHRASYSGCLEIVQALVNEGADVNSENDEGDTPLILAARKLYPDVVEFLLNAGANINYCDEYKYTVLHYASCEGWLSIVRSAVEKGIDVNAKTDLGESPLLLAAENNYPDVVELLLSAGANINCYNRYEWTVLHYASLGREEWLPIAQSLVKKGIDVNAKNEEGQTPLMLGIEENNLDMVELLVSGGANINFCGTDETLVLAAQAGHAEIVKLLVSAGVNVNICNKYKWTLLHSAADDGCVEMAHFLVEKGANVNAEDCSGLTPLHVACNWCGEFRQELIQYLVDSGADCNAVGDGDSPLTLLMKEFGEDDIYLVKLLIEKGAKLTSNEYNLILEIPLLKEGILQDIKICSQVIIDKFNNTDLPQLYKLAESTTNLPYIDKMKISIDRKVTEDIMQTVKHEIDASGHCNVLEACPIVLSMLSVKSFIDNCCNIKVRKQLE